MITVSEVMSTDVTTLNASASISTAKEIMKQEDIRHIPIVDEYHYPVGIVTQRDILKAQSSILKNDNPDMIDESQVSVDKIMTQKVAYTYPEEPLRSAGLKIQKHRYGCLPVMQNNQLVGIITDTDFVGVAIDLIEQMDFTEDF